MSTQQQKADALGISLSTYYRRQREGLLGEPGASKKPVPKPRPIQPTPDPLPLSEPDAAPPPFIETEAYRQLVEKLTLEIRQFEADHPKTHMPTSKVFLSKNLTVAGVAILILLDGVSMGVIGGKAYSWFVSPLFGLAGLAIGYSAIRQVLTYRGWSGEAWKWGFALVQVLLHLCAMDVVPYADISGKVVMSVAGALATAGIVDSMVKEQQPK